MVGFVFAWGRKGMEVMPKDCSEEEITSRQGPDACFGYGHPPNAETGLSASAPQRTALASVSSSSTRSLRGAWWSLFTRVPGRAFSEIQTEPLPLSPMGNTQ
jgi:hypothetical protein